MVLYPRWVTDTISTDSWCTSVIQYQRLLKKQKVTQRTDVPAWLELFPKALASEELVPVL